MRTTWSVRSLSDSETKHRRNMESIEKETGKSVT